VRCSRCRYRRQFREFQRRNGFNAVSGLGTVTVDIMRVVVESNGSVGIQGNQSEGGTVSMTVVSALIDGNNIGVDAIGRASCSATMAAGH
jgi:hypothetical protein